MDPRTHVASGTYYRYSLSIYDIIKPGGSARQCLSVYDGEADDIWADAKAASDRIPGATFFSFPELDHCQTFLLGNLALPRVITFSHSGVTSSRELSGLRATYPVATTVSQTAGAKRPGKTYFG
jgi:hypothetical protein